MGEGHGLVRRHLAERRQQRLQACLNPPDDCLPRGGLNDLVLHGGAYGDGGLEGPQHPADMGGQGLHREGGVTGHVHLQWRAGRHFHEPADLAPEVCEPLSGGGRDSR